MTSSNTPPPQATNESSPESSSKTEDPKPFRPTTPLHTTTPPTHPSTKSQAITRLTPKSPTTPTSILRSEGSPSSLKRVRFAVEVLVHELAYIDYMYGDDDMVEDISTATCLDEYDYWSSGEEVLVKYFDGEGRL